MSADASQRGRFCKNWWELNGGIDGHIGDGG